jgi:hypothetical protein
VQSSLCVLCVLCGESLFKPLTECDFWPPTLVARTSERRASANAPHAPVVTRLIAIRVSKAATTYPPNRVNPASKTMPTAISIASEMCISVAGVTVDSLFEFGNARCDRVVNAVMGELQLRGVVVSRA